MLQSWCHGNQQNNAPQSCLPNWASQVVKNSPANAGDARGVGWIHALGQEDPLEKGTATHFQYSCLETPMDRRAWHAAVHGITKSRT